MLNNILTKTVLSFKSNTPPLYSYCREVYLRTLNGLLTIKPAQRQGFKLHRKIMTTIQFITDSIEQMKKLQVPAKIEIGTFKVTSKGSLINWAGNQGEYNGSIVNFKICFRPDHIQTLLNLGVKIDFDSVKMAGIAETALRYKAGREAIRQGRYANYYYQGNPQNRVTGLIENWLQADAKCTPNALKEIDKYCRENHRNQVSIDNDHNLRAMGWKFKVKYPSFVEIESQYKNPKAIRKTAHGKPESQLLPIQKRLLKRYPPLYI